MTLANPAWLLLLGVLALLDVRWPRLGLRRPLRASVLVVLVLVLADPRGRHLSGGRDVAVLVDRSDSAAENLGPVREEWETLIDRGRGSGDRVFFYDFAAEAVRRDRGDPIFGAAKTESRLETAVRLAMADRGEGRELRLVALTDGFSTEPLRGLAPLLAAGSVPLDFRLTPNSGVGDRRITGLTAPSRVALGGAHLVEFVIEGDTDGPVPWKLMRDGRVAAEGEAQVVDGRAQVRLTDRLDRAGVVAYSAVISPPGDRVSANNEARAWTVVDGGRRVLLLTLYRDDPLGAALRDGGWVVDEVTELGSLSPTRLAGARVVVLNNVPAWRLPSGFLDSLDFQVRSQASGLLVVGGRTSFAAGGYFESAIDPLMPVSMEQRTEHKKLMTAMAIVMDRSGSMAASAGAGVTKMDLANEGAATAANLLGDLDLLSVHAVDSEAHEILPLIRVGSNRDVIQDTVRRINSTGGGIFVYEGLVAGWHSVAVAPVGQRHIVLFSDAADSEEEGAYKTLLQEITQQGATVSVIALGTEQDVDAALLKDIAALGKGRIFFTNDAGTLPQIFAQETVAVARSAFLDSPVAVKGTVGWQEVAARSITWPAQVDGYNLSYLRPGATASALSGDDYAAPLVASWQRGAGRVAAVTFPLGGESSASARAWGGYRDFSLTLTRWLAGADTPPGLALRTQVEGGRLSLELLHDETLADAVLAKPPEAVVSVGAGGKATRLPWTRIEAGVFRAEMDLPPDGVVRGAVTAGGHALPFGPLAGAGGLEWQRDNARVRELRELSRISGGRELLDLRSVWELPMPPQRVAEWRGPLLVCALVLVLVEALLTRLGRKSWTARGGRA